MVKNPTKKLNKLWYTVPVTFFAAGLAPEYFAPVFTVVCFILVSKNNFREKSPLHLGSVGTSFAPLLLWMVVGCFYSKYFVSSLASIGLWLLMLMGYYFTTSMLDTEEKIQKTFLVGSISSGVSGTIGILQMLSFHFSDFIPDKVIKLFNPFWRFLDFEITRLIKFLPKFISSNMARTTYDTIRFKTRACSTFSNPLFFSTISVMMLPFSAYCFLCLKKRSHRLIGLLCFALSCGGIASSYSRGPYLAAFAVVILLFLYGGKKALKLGGVGLGALGVICIFARGTIKRIFTLFSSKDISINTRTEIWKVIWEAISKRPIFGYGTGFNNIRQLLHNANPPIKQPHAHNIFLEIWAENGIIGLIIFLSIFILFAVNLVRLALKGQKQRYYAVTILASVAGFMLCGLTDCLFYGLKPLQYLLMILGIASALFRIFLGKSELYFIPKKLKNKTDRQ